MKPRAAGFDYPEALKAYGKELKGLDALDLTNESDNEFRSLEAKLKIIMEACRANPDALFNMEKEIYKLLAEAEENQDKAKAISDELYKRLISLGGNGKLEAPGEESPAPSRRNAPEQKIDRVALTHGLNLLDRLMKALDDEGDQDAQISTSTTRADLYRVIEVFEEAELYALKVKGGVEHGEEEG